MSLAWETTTDDVATVLNAHGIEYTDERLQELLDSLDQDAIEDGALSYTSMDAQTDSMFDDIETQLMESGVIPKGDKKFVMQDEYEDDEDDFDDDWDDDEDEDFDDDEDDF